MAITSKQRQLKREFDALTAAGKSGAAQRLYTTNRDAFEALKGQKSEPTNNTNDSAPIRMAGGNEPQPPAPNFSDLKQKVVNTDGNLRANDAFVQGAFKAFHNRAPTATEIQNMTGKSVQDVRSLIQSGAPTNNKTVQPEPDLARRVQDTPGELTANKAFVRGAAKALLGRDPNEQELNELAGQSVQQVRQAFSSSNKTDVSPEAKAGDVPLNPTEFDKIRNELGVGEDTFAQVFRRDDEGNIYLREGALDQENFSVDTSQPDAGELESETTDSSFVDMFNEFQQDNLSNMGSQMQAFAKSLEQIWEATKSDFQKQLEQQRNELLGDLEESFDQLEGKEDFKEEQLEEMGFFENKKKIQELNKMIAQKMTAYKQTEADVLNQPIQQGLILGEQKAVLRQRAIDVGQLVMMQEAYMKNTEVAMSVAEEMVNLEFGDVERRISQTATFLDINSRYLTKEEGKQATKIQSLLGERSRLIKKQKSERERNYELMVSVAQQGGDPNVIDPGKPFDVNFNKVSDLFADAGQQLSQTVQMEDGSVLLLDQNGNEINRIFPEGSSGSIANMITEMDHVDSNIGSGTVTSIGGESGSPWWAGLDIQLDGGKNAEVKAPFGFKVKKIVKAEEGSDFGNSVRIIREEDGQEFWFSHFDTINETLEEGKSYNMGTQLGMQGNTGKTFGKTGIHVDVSMPKTDNPSMINGGQNGDWHSPQTVAQEMGVRYPDDSKKGQEIADIGNAMKQLQISLPEHQSENLEENVNRLLGAGDFEGAREALQSAVYSALPSTESKASIGRFRGLKALERIDAALKEYEAAGGDTNVLAGNFLEIAERVGAAYGDGELNTIATEIEAATIAYRHAVSGVAFNAQEAKQYARLFPSAKNVSQLNTAKINGLKNSMEADMKNTIIPFVGKGNYEAIYGSGGSAVDQQMITAYTDKLTGRNKADGSLVSRDEARSLAEQMVKLFNAGNNEQQVMNLVNESLGYEVDQTQYAPDPETPSGGQSSSGFDWMGLYDMQLKGLSGVSPGSLKDLGSRAFNLFE